jgi:L-alanine-DL-glutamate epimerase-like enolase superfamily enzyme
MGMEDLYMGINRRSFLKIAGLAGTMGGRAMARGILLLDVDPAGPITRIDWIPYDTGEPERRCAVRVWADSGVQGWADAPSSARPSRAVADSIRPVLSGCDVSQQDTIWRKLYEQGVPLGTLSAVDIALWDLWGRMEGKPVHALLGTRRQKVNAYFTTGFNARDPQRYVEDALSAQQAGIHGCKIHPYIDWGKGAGGLQNAGFPDQDMAVYQAVRSAVGPDYACMADNYGTYTVDDALRVGRLLDSLGYEWYESPMPENEEWRDKYIALGAQLKTPICAPETHSDSYASRISWLTAKACDIASIDAYHGGLTACLELALACEDAGARLELHDLGPDAYAHLQLLGATSDAVIKYVEVTSLVRENRTRPGRLTPDPTLDDQGRLAIPQTPGMGVEPDWTYIYSHRVA